MLGWEDPIVPSLPGLCGCLSPRLQLLSSTWGEPGIEVRTAEPGEILDAAWKAMPSWAIIPFESLEPRWKVLTIDGESPIRKDFDADAYPLRFRFALIG